MAADSEIPPHGADLVHIDMGNGLRTPLWFSQAFEFIFLKKRYSCRLPNPKFKIQNPKSKIQNPKSKIQNPKSKIE
jgi:hypothetical protein